MIYHEWVSWLWAGELSHMISALAQCQSERGVQSDMDVCFHDEQVDSKCFDRDRINRMSFRNEQKTDLIDRLRTQATHLVTICSPLEFGMLIPQSDPHDGLLSDVVLRQIMNLVVRIVAPEPNSCKYQNVPLVHAFAATLFRCISIDVTSDQRHDYFSDVGPEVHMLKRSQNRFDRVSAFEAEFNLIDRWNVQTKLG